MSRTMPLARSLLSIAALGRILLICSGRVHAPMIAAYLAIFAGTGLVTAFATDFSQDGERRKPGPEEVHPSSRLAASGLFLATVIVAALDVGRFHWTTTLSGPIQMAALAMLILAVALQVWAMIANPLSTRSGIVVKAGMNRQRQTLARIRSKW